jgi:hypothetical protein
MCVYIYIYALAQCSTRLSLKVTSYCFASIVNEASSAIYGRVNDGDLPSSTGYYCFHTNINEIMYVYIYIICGMLCYRAGVIRNV